MLTFITFLLLQSVFPTLKQDPTARDVLQKTSSKLNGAKTMEYDYKRELAYRSERIYDTLDVKVFLDFSSPDTLIGLKYQMDYKKSIDIFNGTEKFTLNREEKTMQLTTRPTFKSFSSMSAFYNSPLTLRNTITTLLANPGFKPTLKDTTVNDVPCYAVKFALYMEGLEYIKGLMKITEKRNITYLLIINKGSFLPISVYQGNNVNSDYTRTSFANFKLDSTPPDELSWYYPTYSNEYALKSNEKRVGLIKPGSDAPVWNLISFDDDLPVSSDKYKGKVLLLDFWIKNCGPCIAAVPELNALQQKFKGKDFVLLGINCYDPNSMISVFKNNFKPAYPILYNGEATAKTYGIPAYPTVVMVGKDGKVIYSGGYEKNLIEKLIQANL